MGIKTHKATLLAGSLIDTWLKFARALHFELNYNDRVGHRVASRELLEITYIDDRLLNPEFTLTFHAMDKPILDTFMAITFINDHVQVYNLNVQPWEQIQSHIKMLNSYIDIDEALKGRDHTYPDDFHVL